MIAPALAHSQPASPAFATRPYLPHPGLASSTLDLMYSQPTHARLLCARPSANPGCGGDYVLLEVFNEVYCPVVDDCPSNTAPISVSINVAQNDVIESVNRSDAAKDFLLSPNAIPFMPSVCGHGSPVLGVVNSKDSDGGVEDFVSGAVVPIGIETELPSLGEEECVLIANSLVEVPVCEVDTQVMANCVGNSSGLEIRNQNNWLIDSSDVESDSESFHTDHEFDLGRNSKIDIRGKFWGRGRRRR
ncbi:hypothetical protein MA16_Dca012384 [Dendrobium catenatum]|uniref:Uncharacterized protein n=1 Tax=Dendrobium catenatum TaxID=906689 RepID=A0A2I0WYA2_9ASPA|nr:hypothetical protein MA16_Dca012384 [Dendrobium catenatum]